MMLYRKTGFIITLLIPLLVVLSSTGLAGSLVEKLPSGQIDWSRLIVEAEGHGLPDPEMHGAATARKKAADEAERRAYRNLLDTVMAVRLLGDKTIAQQFSQKDAVLSKIEDILNSAKTVSTRYLSDGTIIKHMAFPLTGALAQLILPENIVSIESQEAGNTSDNSDRDAYTGLVVNARGLNLKPALCIKILDEQGEPVYGPALISREYAVQNGVCSYMIQTKAEDGDMKKRVGKSPMIVRAIRVIGPGASDLAISNTDASRIRATVSHLLFLRRCRVMILCGDAGSSAKTD